MACTVVRGPCPFLCGAELRTADGHLPNGIRGGRGRCPAQDLRPVVWSPPAPPLHRPER